MSVFLVSWWRCWQAKTANELADLPVRSNTPRILRDARPGILPKTLLKTGR
jgi:hypothetical protein